MKTTLGALLIGAMCAACTNGGFTTPAPDPLAHGKTVLCDSGTGTLPGRLLVRNDAPHSPIVDPRILGAGTTAATVCAFINQDAGTVGFATRYGGEGATGVEIGSDNPDNIDVTSENITLQITPF